MIVSEINKEWGDEIPSFRPYFTEQTQQLEEFSKKLASQECYAFKRCHLGQNAIKEMVKITMTEKRRKSKNSVLHSGESDLSTDTASSTDSSPSIKKAKYDKYFHPGQCISVL